VDSLELVTPDQQPDVELQKVIDEHTQPGGIKVSLIEVTQAGLPVQMQRAMAPSSSRFLSSL
jgi:regulator of protease activity HflC (stomatin/prohibitin superfamily)